MLSKGEPAADQRWLISDKAVQALLVSHTRSTFIGKWFPREAPMTNKVQSVETFVGEFSRPNVKPSLSSWLIKSSTAAVNCNHSFWEEKFKEISISKIYRFPPQNSVGRIQEIKNPLLQQLFSKTAIPLSAQQPQRDPYQTNFQQVINRVFFSLSLGAQFQERDHSVDRSLVRSWQLITVVLL